MTPSEYFAIGVLAGFLACFALIAIVAALFVPEQPSPSNVIDINSRRGK